MRRGRPFQAAYHSAFDPQGPLCRLPTVLCGQGGRVGSEGQAALRESQEGESPILSLHHTSHLFSRLAGA